MIKYIQLNSEDFKSAIEIVKKAECSNRLLLRLNHKTYGGLITLDGTSEDIECLCSFLQDNGITTDWNINFNSDRIEMRNCFF